MVDSIGKIDLNIFGAVTASISHEIKNRMAVINEHAGLMQDRILMSKRGGDINIEGMKRSADKIKQQITMADAIISNMNRFAHSVDKDRQQVDLHEASVLAAALFQRTASAREISLEVPATDSSVTVETSFFHLLGLIWMCLKTAIATAAPNSTVTIRCGMEGEKPELKLKMDAEAGTDMNGKISESAKILANEIGAEMQTNSEQHTIVVRFP